MNIEQLVAQAKSSAEGRLDDIPEGKAAALVKAVFAQLTTALKGSKDPLKINGFGTFQVKEIEREIEGQAKIIRKIRFRPGVQQPKKEGAGKGKGKGKGKGRAAAAPAADTNTATPGAPAA